MVVTLKTIKQVYTNSKLSTRSLCEGLQSNFSKKPCLSISLLHIGKTLGVFGRNIVEILKNIEKNGRKGKFKNGEKWCKIRRELKY